MPAKRSIPIPLVIVLVCAVGAVVMLNREPAFQRVPDALATTPLDAPIGSFSEAWSIAQRVLREKSDEFTLRTLVVAVPVDRNAPPTSMHLAFRSVSNDRDFYIRIDNADLEIVISATFSTPPQLRSLGAPEPVDVRAVRVTLRRALAIADSALALRQVAASVGTSAPEISTDVVLRTRHARPEWSVSYVRDVESGSEVVATVVLDASDGSLQSSGGS